MHRATLLLALLPLAGCKARPTGEPSSEPSSPEEKVVKSYIERRANDPASVEYQEWGPSLPLTPEDCEDWFGADADAVVRVAYHQKNEGGAVQFYDRLFLVKGGRVTPWRDNREGADWQKRVTARRPKR